VSQHQVDKETDHAVLQPIEWFQDQKFGLVRHWGLYSQWGIVKSWSICNEDEQWCHASWNIADGTRTKATAFILKPPLQNLASGCLQRSFRSLS
jgi:hypothetical protein